MDKSKTKELISSLQFVLIGIFFWVIKVRYFTFFWLPKDHLLNIIGLEIVGTILILIAITIIFRVYPFVYSNFAFLLCWIILLINIFNIINFFFFKFDFFYNFEQYTPFIMSVMLFFMAKLINNATKYLGNLELSKKWEYMGVIIFFGFSIPYYILISLHISGCIKYEILHLNKQIILLFIPIAIVVLFLFIYYLSTLVLTFKFLKKIEENNQ